MFRAHSFVAAAVLSACVPNLASAQVLTGDLVLNSGTSTLTAGGSALGTPVTQQGSGSLVANYSGMFSIESLDLSNLEFSFSATTNFVAGNSGSWNPLPGGGEGMADANYGGVIDLGGGVGGVTFAIRNLTATISTLTPIALTPLGGNSYSFSTNQTFTLLSPSVLDYRGFGPAGGLVGSGSTSLSNVATVNTGATGTLTDLGGGNFSLSFPIALTFNEEFGGQPATITLGGTFNAMGGLSPVPEPSSFVAVSMMAIAAFALRRRKTSANRQAA